MVSDPRTPQSWRLSRTVAATLILTVVLVCRAAMAQQRQDCVDINSAAAAELQRIVHIAEVRAGEIVRLRRQRPFASVGELTRVRGIAQGRLRDITTQGLACVRATTAVGGSTQGPMSTERATQAAMPKRPMKDGDRLLPDTTAGSWEYVERVDAMTDEVLRHARSRNGTGFELSVFRLSSGRVHGLFRVPDSVPDVLSSRRYPTYRIDRLDPVDLEGSRSLVELLDEPPVLHEPKWVQFLVWHGEGSYPENGTLHDLMHGERIVFRYYLFTSGFKETEFLLDGAADTIVRALNLLPPDTSESTAATGHSGT